MAKKDPAGQYRVPNRVERVIDKVRAMANETGASPEVVEQVWRAMIAAFINEELKTLTLWRTLDFWA